MADRKKCENQIICTLPRQIIVFKVLVGYYFMTKFNFYSTHV